MKQKLTHLWRDVRWVLVHWRTEMQYLFSNWFDTATLLLALPVFSFLCFIFYITAKLAANTVIMIFF